MAHSQINIIFDLDETLIHSRPSSRLYKPREVFPDEKMGVEEHADGYITAIRPIAHELVRFAREVAGERVYIATVGMQDYAYAICKKEFGLPVSNIFTREDISYCWNNNVTPNMANEANSILIDNLDPKQNKAKVEVFKVKKYIKPKEFDPILFKFCHKEDQKELARIKKEISDYTRG